MNKSTIVCPKCQTVIDVEEVLKHSLEDKVRSEYQEKYAKDIQQLHIEREKLSDERKKLDEYKEKEREVFQKKLAEEVKLKLNAKEQELKEMHLKTIEDLQKKVAHADVEKIKVQQLELELKKQEELYLHKISLEKSKLEVELRNALSEQIKKEEQEKSELKFKDLEIKLEQQKKHAEEMQRKLNQGSMETQGEVSEQVLEEKLRRNFPLDEVIEIKKGERGGDILLNVRNERIGYCGSILFECKNTVTYDKDWIEKLKLDQKNKNAHLAILVSKTFPKEKTNTSFYYDKGIWICNFKEAISLTEVLRAQIIRLKEIEISQHGKEEKSIAMYQYLQSDRFRNAMQEIANSFMTMKNEIIKERAAMEKHWKNRDAMIDKMMNHSLDVHAQIRSIGGGEIIELPDFEIS